MKTIRQTIIVLLIMVFLCLPSYICAAEYAKGQIASAALIDEKIYFTTGDKLYANLGMKDGVIKGDILNITTLKDVDFLNPTGRCALIRVDSDLSVCRLIKAINEIERGNAVYIDKLFFQDERLSLPLYTLLYKTAEPYEPYKKINVYIGNIFDSKLNTTKYSTRLKKEIEKTYYQKKKFIVREDFPLKNFMLYPLNDKDSTTLIKNFMSQENIDVFITGVYTLENDTMNVTLYKYDKYYDLEMLPFLIKVSKGESGEANEIISTYKPVEKNEFIPCTISYKELTESLLNYSKADIVKYESGGDMFKENDFKAREFNIIAPSEVVVLVDNERVRFDEMNEFSTLLNKGPHKITASFKRGYYFNSRGALVYSSQKTIKKEMLLLVKKDGDLYVEITLSPSLYKESINFKTYKEMVNIRPQIKGVSSIKKGASIETFID